MARIAAIADKRSERVAEAVVFVDEIKAGAMQMGAVDVAAILVDAAGNAQVFTKVSQSPAVLGALQILSVRLAQLWIESAEEGAAE